MNLARKTTSWIAAGFASIGILVGSAQVFAESSPELAWRPDKRADAQLENVPLPKVLSRLGALTGWKVYMQPGVDRKISVKFKNLPQRDALRMLFGDLSYALLPQTGGAGKLYVFESSISEATAFVRPDASARPKNWLANELIVSFAPGAAHDIDKLAAELGAKVVAKGEGLNAYRLEFADAESADAARENIANRSDVAYHDNYSFDRPTLTGGGSPAPEALFPLDSKPVTRGEQITVALVDTPIQPLDGKMKDFVLPSIAVGELGSTPANEPTHATSMANTILNSLALQGTPEAGKVRIQPIDIYGNNPSTTTFEVAGGLHKAIQSGAQVINLSLGGAGESPMVDYLLEMAHKKEILVFASAGNSPTTDLTFPAANPNAIAVTATDWSGNIAPYANRGSFVDVKAPGQSKVYFNGQTYISSGTSTATAYVSGQAAAYSARGYNANDTAAAILKNFDINAAPRARR